MSKTIIDHVLTRKRANIYCGCCEQHMKEALRLLFEEIELYKVCTNNALLPSGYIVIPHIDWIDLKKREEIEKCQ